MIETVTHAGRALRVVRSPLLSGIPGLAFGISTRAGGVSSRPYDLNLSFRVGDDESSVRENRARFFGSLGIRPDRLAVPMQVHGDVIRVADTPGSYEACDGLVTSRKGLFLAISVADCVPVFAVDPVHGAVGAFHAGWRGAKLGIVAKGIALMASEFGTDPTALLAVIGQSAGACCYEVGEEVAGEFEDRFVVRPPGAKPRLDLHAHAWAALVGSGVPAPQVDLLADCTICHPEEFHSYRRERESSGRMMGAVGFRDAEQEAEL
jgi:YfiH family protein